MDRSLLCPTNMMPLASMLMFVSTTAAMNAPRTAGAHDARLVPSPIAVSSPSAAFESEIRTVIDAVAPRMSIVTRRELAQTIAVESERHDIHPDVILALIMTESRFDSRAVSVADARGLMQLLPSTARSFAERAGVRWRGANTLFDPIANVRIGTTYLAYLIGRFDGDLSHALAAYCYGPMRIRRRIRRAPIERTEYTDRITDALSVVRPHFITDMIADA